MNTLKTRSGVEMVMFKFKPFNIPKLYVNVDFINNSAVDKMLFLNLKPGGR